MSPILIYISTVGDADAAHKAPEQRGSEASDIWDNITFWHEESNNQPQLFIFVCIRFKNQLELLSLQVFGPASARQSWRLMKLQIIIQEEKMVTFNVNRLLYSVRILFIFAFTVQLIYTDTHLNKDTILTLKNFPIFFVNYDINKDFGVFLDCLLNTRRNRGSFCFGLCGNFHT